MEKEKRIKIEEAQDLQIEKRDNTPLINSVEAFESAYITGLHNNGVDLLSADTKIIKNADNSFSICAPSKISGKLTEYVKVQNIDLVKKFIYEVTDKHYRAALSDLNKSFDVSVASSSTSDAETGVESATEEIVIREKLDQLKDDISFTQIIDGAKALTTGGILHLDNGTTKFFRQGQAEELNTLIRKSKPKADDIMYKQNLEIFTQIIKEQTETCKNIQKQARDLQNNKNKENHAEIIQTRKQEEDRIYNQFTQMELYLTNPTMMNKPFDAATYQTDLAIYSSQDIKILESKITTQDKEATEINESLFNTALLKLDLQDRQEFRTYLNNVITNKIDPATNKYEPKNLEAFKAILQDCPRVKGYIRFPKENEKKSNKEVTGVARAGESRKEVQTESEQSYATLQEAFAKGGVAGAMKYGIDMTNMSPEQKKFRGGAGQLAMTAGMVFVGWKMLFSAFNLITGKNKAGTAERRTDIARLLGPAAILFTSHAVTGEGPLAFFTGGKGTEMLANGKLFGGKESKEGSKEHKISKEFKEKYGEGFPGLTAIFHGAKYSEIKDLVEEKDGRIKLKDESYEPLLAKMKKEKNIAGVAFLESIGKNDNGYLIDLAFKGMGMSIGGLDSTPDKKFDETAALSIVKLQAISAKMEEGKFASVNPDNIKMLEDYIANEDSDLDDLDDLANRGDVFLKEVEIKDETGLNLGAKITTMSRGNKKQEKGLLVGLNTFYKNMPNADKKIDITGEGPEVVFMSYGQKVKINIDKKSLVGFTPKAFDTYLELFKVANLTNYIQFLFKDKVATTNVPFQVGNLLGDNAIENKLFGDIVFDNKKFKERGLDTKAISGGRGGSLSEISPILEENKAVYCTYLNGLTNWKVRARTVEQAPRLDMLPVALVAQIDHIAGTNAQRKKDLTQGMREFYTEWPNASRKVELLGNRPVVKFKTYEQMTTINLENKSLDGFEASRFPSYKELFKAANLTNRIKTIVSGKDARSDGKPFYLRNGDIVFNDEGRSLSTDTEIIGGGRFSSLKDISPVLNTNRDAYVAYLNTLWDRTGLRDKVRAFVGDNSTQEQNIISALNTFHDQMPNNEKRLDIINAQRPYLEFVSYGQKTKLNMNELSIVGFTPTVFFPSHVELLKAASLTNRIKQICKNKEYGKDPFNISGGGDIEFAEKGIFTRDTEIVAGGLRGTLKTISPKLEEHKAAYVKYLNGLKFWKIS